MELVAILFYFFLNTEGNKWAFQQATFASGAMVCPPPGKALVPERLGRPAECEGLLTKKTHTHIPLPPPALHPPSNSPEVKSSCWK